jgi:hypothetical protein
MTRGQKTIAARTKREIREGRAAAKRLALKRKSVVTVYANDNEPLKPWPILVQDDPNIRLPSPVRAAIERANGYYKVFLPDRRIGELPAWMMKFVEEMLRIAIVCAILTGLYATLVLR